MARRAPPPYPLAGPETRTDERLRADGRDGAPSSSRRPAVIGLVAAVTAVGLLAAVGWLIAQRSADQARIEALTQERDQATIAAELYRSALESAGLAHLGDGQARSTEMVAASAAIARFLEAYDPSGDPPSNSGFARSFFDREVRTTVWQAIPGQAWPGRVLARVDRAADPSAIWVSRRLESTADPSVPARTNCLRLDVSALLRSVVSGRSFASPNDAPALAWWQDAYSFVPDAFCGITSAE
jgi:hypothetical protein